MEKIKYSKEVEIFLNDLVDLLFEKEYFGFKDSSLQYVQSIKEDIENLIDLKQHFKSPKELLKFGTYYSSFKGSKRTVWYVFFKKKKGQYIVKYITNNHTVKASFINQLK